ncbi:growth/differentiation factor 11-like [Tropilaelaps mercedesae]|uniref:Growth/differentiation factor 11-like n=1 Tax=Tropilaelaps mercedesae TaxID=418985 RepID=A0A1V9WYN9_9ACAR|nr:growth/differentiation factor 11-like [Tropilaelaps mercedesae]
MTLVCVILQRFAVGVDDTSLGHLSFRRNISRCNSARFVRGRVKIVSDNGEELRGIRLFVINGDETGRYKHRPIKGGSASLRSSLSTAAIWARAVWARTVWARTVWAMWVGNITCPSETRSEVLLCLKFDISRVLHTGSIVRAEIGVFFSSVYSQSFNLREVRKNFSQGPRVNGTSSKGWVRFDATSLVTRWTKDPNEHQKPASIRTVQLVCPNCPPGSYNHIRDAKESPFLFVVVAPQKINRRLRRSVDCSMSNIQKGCCRAPFEVSFHDDIGWRWIVMPKTFTPNFCRGQCELEVNMLGPHGLAKNGYIKAYPRQAQNIELAMCCAPKVLRPLTIVYFVNKDTLNVTTIPDMIVEECHCT